VLGLADTHTDDDIGAWGNLEVKACEVVGPPGFGYAPDMTGALNDQDPAIVHHVGLWKYHAVACHRWAKQHHRPYIVSPHGMLERWALKNAAWKKRIAGWLYGNAHLQEAACIHALNQAEARAIRDYGLENPICVIPNGVDLPTKSRAGANGRSTAPWKGLGEEGSNVLLFLGRIHPKKGLHHLIEAWGAVAPENWHLAIVGWDDGGHEAQLKQLVRDYGLRDTVRFMGPMYGSKKEEAFSHADAFALPSHSEGLPMAVLEAWSYRLPVLMTPECNIPEGFEAGAALRVGPDISSIAQGLRRLAATSREERAAMGEQGRALVENQFTWPRVAQQVHHVYRWMLGEAEKPNCVLVNTN
jgi:poly(glycerol-phosphate) alpha-glucosyltransferase